MLWLYRLQQRLSITRHEGLAVLALTVLFLTGLTVRHIQEQQVPPLTVDSLVVDSAAESVSTPSQSSPTPSEGDSPVNVNTASQQALQTLPGVGPVLAKRIKRYRSTQRPFQRIAELKRVPGIGSKTLASLRPLVEVASSDNETK